MNNSDLTVLILSCDKYSDLWDGQIKMLRRFFPDRTEPVILVSETDCKKSYDEITIFPAGQNTEFSERLEYALKTVTTDYVLIILDDYYLTEEASSEKLSALTTAMQKEQIDYLRLYSLPRSKEKIEGYSDLFSVNLKKSKYAVNLFPAIWLTEFVSASVLSHVSAWKYEVSLTKTAAAQNRKCAMTYSPYYRINDIIRQGKIQHKSVSFLKKNGIRLENREICSLSSEIKHNMKVFIKVHVPKGIWTQIKRLLTKVGMKFYSD